MSCVERNFRRFILNTCVSLCVGVCACMLVRVFQIWPFFEFQAALFYSVYKCYRELPEKIWGHLEVIWPPRQTPYFLANIRKWNFSNILKTHHMIHQSTQNLMLISEMYRVIGLFWVFHIFWAAKVWKDPLFLKNSKNGPILAFKSAKNVKYSK